MWCYHPARSSGRCRSWRCIHLCTTTATTVRHLAWRFAIEITLAACIDCRRKTYSDCQTEINQHIRAERRIVQKIAGLDVAMDDLQTMDVLQRYKQGSHVIANIYNGHSRKVTLAAFMWKVRQNQRGIILMAQTPKKPTDVVLATNESNGNATDTKRKQPVSRQAVALGTCVW
jgi:hypothetical protein